MPVLETEGSGVLSGKGRRSSCKGTASRPRERARETSETMTSTVIAQPSRVAPGPIPSCISTIARGRSFPVTLASISSGGPPRQSSVSAVQPTRVSRCFRATSSVAGVTTPHGVRQRRTGPANAVSPDSTSASISSGVMASWRTCSVQCKPTSCPSARTRARREG